MKRNTRFLTALAVCGVLAGAALPQESAAFTFDTERSPGQKAEKELSVEASSFEELFKGSTYGRFPWEFSFSKSKSTGFLDIELERPYGVPPRQWWAREDGRYRETLITLYDYEAHITEASFRKSEFISPNSPDGLKLNKGDLLLERFPYMYVFSEGNDRSTNVQQIKQKRWRVKVHADECSREEEGVLIDLVLSNTPFLADVEVRSDSDFLPYAHYKYWYKIKNAEEVDGVNIYVCLKNVRPLGEGAAKSTE